VLSLLELIEATIQALGMCPQVLSGEHMFSAILQLDYHIVLELSLRKAKEISLEDYLISLHHLQSLMDGLLLKDQQSSRVSRRSLNHMLLLSLIENCLATLRARFETQDE